MARSRVALGKREAASIGGLAYVGFNATHDDAHGTSRSDDRDLDPIRNDGRGHRASYVRDHDRGHPSQERLNYQCR
jgi:hypothetical protein